MKFRYSKSPHPKTKAHPDLKWFRRPIISLDIINGSRSARIYALIDSGSDFCLFQGSLGTQIGLNVPNGKLEEIIGITGIPIKSYFHNIELKIGGWRIPCFAGFSFELDNLPLGILGQDGFFSKYRIMLDYSGESIELREFQPTKKQQKKH